LAWSWAKERLLTGAPAAVRRSGPIGRRAPYASRSRAGSELLVYSREPPRDVRDAWAQTVNILKAFRDETAARDARLLVVYVPSKMEVGDRDWELTQGPLRAWTSRTWDRRRVASELL
jgi:hypothetical protein